MNSDGLVPWFEVCGNRTKSLGMETLNGN